MLIGLWVHSLRFPAIFLSNCALKLLCLVFACTGRIRVGLVGCVTLVLLYIISCRVVWNCSLGYVDVYLSSWYRSMMNTFIGMRSSVFMVDTLRGIDPGVSASDPDNFGRNCVSSVIYLTICCWSHWCFFYINVLNSMGEFWSDAVFVVSNTEIVASVDKFWELVGKFDWCICWWICPGQFVNCFV